MRIGLQKNLDGITTAFLFRNFKAQAANIINQRFSDLRFIG
jgi:hypothetical protein